MHTRTLICLLLLLGIFGFPTGVYAQGAAAYLGGLQSVLDKVYAEMIPLCSDMIGLGRAVAGFGALWYIASRVWRQIASAEPVDVYPLLRPFALGLAILLFPALLSVMNGVLNVTVAGTSAMKLNSDAAIKALLKKKEVELKKSDKWKAYVGTDGGGDRAKWYKLAHPNEGSETDEGWMESIGNDIKFWADRQDYKIRHSFKQFISEVLELLYQAAALCINTMRTFFLIVMAILGPIVLGFAVYDGLQHTLTVWIARYINIFLWLPIANIFGAILGKIQQNMLKLDISEVQQNGDTFFSSTDTAYLIFMIIGILGYFSVPTIANYVVHAGGGNPMLNKVNSLVVSTGAAAAGSVSANTSSKGKGGGMEADRNGDGHRNTAYGMAEESGQDYFRDKLSGK